MMLFTFTKLASSKEVAEAGSFIHGAFGNNPLKFLKAALDIAKQKESQAAKAFIYGMITHYAVDASFHPLVYYFTGNYYSEDPAEENLTRIRHRRLEVYLDSWWKHNFNCPKHKASFLLRVSAPYLDEICGILTQALDQVSPENKVDAEIWYKSLEHLVFICGVTNSFIIGAIVKAVSILTGGKLDSAESISKFMRKKAHSFF